MDENGFDPTKWIPVESSDLSWHILGEVKILAHSANRAREFNDVEMSVTSFKDEPLFPVGWMRVSFVGCTEGITSEAPCVWNPNIDVALSSGADVCANSGPFARERVTFRHNGACVCAIPACLLWLPLPLGWAWVYGVSCTSPVRVICSDSVSSPMGVVARCGLQSAREGDLF